MAIANYCAFQVTHRVWPMAHTARANVLALEARIQEVLFPLINNDPSLVITPRFNNTYLSVRFCGLEIFRVSRNGRVKFVIGEIAGVLRNLGGDGVDIDLQNEAQVVPAMNILIEVCQFVQAYRMGPNEENALVPGFGTEHWLESMIMADNHFGEANRHHLGININLLKCVTQAPVTPLPGGRKARFVDILSVSDNGAVSIVELKINNDVAKANEELTSYFSYFANRDYIANYPYPPELRWGEGYLPDRNADAAGGWAENLNPRCLVVATVDSQVYETKLLRQNFVNHIPDIWIV